MKAIYLLFALLFILFQLAMYLPHENHRDEMKEAGGQWVWAVLGISAACFLERGGIYVLESV